jgi:hypothetical protein
MSKPKLPPPQRTRNPLAELGWPALSKEDAERVLKLVRGQSGDDCQRDTDILREAAISVQWIKRKTASTQSAAKRKAALHKVAENIRAVIKSIENLPTERQYELDPEALRRTQEFTPLPGYDYGAQRELQSGTLQRLLDRTLALADKITVKRSGGKQRGRGGGRIEAAQKRAAADSALHLLLAWSNKGRPTLTRNGPYFELAAVLFEAAGKVGDVELACKARLRAKTVSTREEEMWEMLFESNGVPKVFEASD